MVITFNPKCDILSLMGNFNRGGNRGGGGGRFFGRDGFGRKDFGGGDRGGSRGGFGGGRGGDREMFKTTCSNCGKDCEVPFRPTNSKPVYCNDCFPKFNNRGGDDRRGAGDRPRFSDRGPQAPAANMNNGQFENLNIKLDKILRLLQPVTVAPEKKVAEVKEAVVMESAVASEVVETPKVKKASKKKVSKE